MTTYYVDSVSGNDANAGTSEDSAWQTIAKVNASPFAAGDFVRFKRGQTFRDDSNIFIIDQGGNVGADVTYGVYGDANDVTKAIINASRLVTSWTNTVGQEYKADLAASQGGVDPRSVWQDVSTQLVLGTAGVLALGEYEYDAVNDELHVRLDDGSDPTDHVIEAANIRNCVYVQASYVTIEDISFEKGNTYNIDISAQAPVITNITLTRVESNRGAWHGIRIGDAGATNTPNNVTIDDCKVYMWNRGGTVTEDAISLFDGNNTHGNNFIVRDTIIEGDIAWGVNTNNGRNGIELGGGDNHIIERNDISGCDHGIKLQSLVAGWTIRYNFIHEIGDDGFEITNVDSSTGIIHNNILYRVSDQFFGVNLAVAGSIGRIYNNTCYESLNEAISLTGPDGTTAIIKNNIFGITQNPSQRFYVILDVGSTIDITDFDIDYNVYYDYVDSPGTDVFAKFQSGNISFTQWQALGLDANSQVVNPELYNPDDSPTKVSNFNIEFTTSPAVDAGVDVSLTEDFIGTTIPQRDVPDIGAYESIPRFILQDDKSIAPWPGP
jgi:hypothetical protein